MAEAYRAEDYRCAPCVLCRVLTRVECLEDVRELWLGRGEPLACERCADEMRAEAAAEAELERGPDCCGGANCRVCCGE